MPGLRALPVPIRCGLGFAVRGVGRGAVEGGLAVRWVVWWGGGSAGETDHFGDVHLLGQVADWRVSAQAL